ncbi:hypothetical protein [Massilia sp. CCM 8734]|uniref:hypothetical protein n=1 Tax=Massilia sp. CCM 8734 TaxID=2609283 RepID=UPI0014242CF2|nr:hypothetical protein [Massilia sp. CCM 8734]NIA00936.1 hypothetical protein [Massilia sp. CCM 8734]
MLVASELDGKVHVFGDGEEYNDSSFSNSGSKNPNRGGPRRLKMIDGYAFMCGGNRSVAKMVSQKSWFSHTHLLPVYPDVTRGGFDDIDGFNENDLYAVGGKGDVCRFDGLRWQEVAFPSNAWISTVCCGGDGNVYISGVDGLTFVGRENRWKKINEGGVNLGFRSMVWYGDRVWCTNDYGVWTIHKNKIAKADLPSEIAICAGYLAVGDGVMLLAGANGAALLQNDKWQSILICSEMESSLKSGGNLPATI